MSVEVAENTLNIRVTVPVGLTEEQRSIATCAVEQTGEAINGWLASVASGEANDFDLQWVTGQVLVDGSSATPSSCGESFRLDAAKNAFAHELAGDAPNRSEYAQVKLALLSRSFTARRELFVEAATIAQVAEMLGISRQAVHNKVRKTLFGAFDNGVLRIPLWQFDPQTESGVLEGLPEVIKALTEAKVSPVAQISWMVRNNPFLDGRTPSECLQQGEVLRVVDAAHGIGLK